MSAAGTLRPCAPGRQTKHLLEQANAEAQRTSHFRNIGMCTSRSFDTTPGSNHKQKYSLRSMQLDVRRDGKLHIHTFARKPLDVRKKGCGLNPLGRISNMCSQSTRPHRKYSIREVDMLSSDSGPPMESYKTSTGGRKDQKPWKLRQHVNPLARHYTEPQAYTADEWKEVYSQRSHPLHLDLGCGLGGYLNGVASDCKDWNYLGLDIRQPYIEYATATYATDAVQYRQCNVNFNLEALLESLPVPLAFVSMLFSDPWWKSAHAKRRMVTPELIQTLTKHMYDDTNTVPGQPRYIYVKSDEQIVIDQASMSIKKSGAPWVRHMGIIEDHHLTTAITKETERDITSKKRGRPVFTCLWTMQGEGGINV